MGTKLALRSNSRFWEQMHTILTYNFDLQFHSQFCNYSFAFAFLHFQIAFANFNRSLSITILHFIRSFPEFWEQMQSTILHFWKCLQFCIYIFDISNFIYNFAFPDCHCIFHFLEAFAVLHFLETFYQQFASQKITKTITKRQIPAAIPETNNIKFNARRTLFLQVLLTTCPPYLPTRIVLAPFAS